MDNGNCLDESMLTILMFNYLIKPLKKGTVCCSCRILKQSEKYRDRYVTVECYMSLAAAPITAAPCK